MMKVFIYALLKTFMELKKVKGDSLLCVSIHCVNFYFIISICNCVFIVGAPVFVEQLSPQVRTVIRNDLLLRCQAVSDELLDMAYIWTHNSIPLLNSNAEIIKHVVSIN